ncbi:hypothetical protein D3C72_1695980 [compost metagenome]
MLRRLGRHQRGPRAELVAHQQFIGAAHVLDGLLLLVLAVLAVQAHPRIALRGERGLDALEDMHVVMRHHRHRRESQAVVGQRAPQQRLRRASGHQSPDLDQGPVDAERPDHAQRLRRALQRQQRVEDDVLRRKAQYLVRPRFAMGLRHRPAIVVRDGVAGMDAGVGAEHAVAVRIDSRARLREELVARPERQQLLQRHGRRCVGRPRIVHRTGCRRNRFVR